MPETLTVQLLRHLQGDPPAKRRDLVDADCPGLVARVTPTGRVSLVHRYRGADGRQRRSPVGVWPGTSLAEARARVRARQAALFCGEDPDPPPEGERPTLRRIVEEWDRELAAMVRRGERSGKHRREAVRALRADVLPALGHIPADQLSATDVARVIRAVRGRAPVMGDRVLAYLRACLAWARTEPDLLLGVERDPTAGTPRAKRRAMRSRILDWDEVREIWSAIDDGVAAQGRAIQALLLTGQRLGAIRDARWDEIDAEGWWQIPPGRVKGGAYPATYLTPGALEVLRQGQGRRHPEWIFDGTRGGSSGRPIQTVGNWIDRWREGHPRQRRWTAHDLRRTVATRLAELGVDRLEIEIYVLGHRARGAGAHYHHAVRYPRTREILTHWQRHLLALVGAGGEGVLAFRPLRRAK